ncbi:adaptin ear-binding coat-associated protein 1 [Aplysia californica]|uniref:Adaptin ear-binding coat-associated protein 1 n=1 Tax=Aplysia californica TaxID=6500 RepID=A0ABM0JQQ2_APLCA|nr:adaptin ear-binding coat-associated protein 1 [Aplysia californica]
MADTAYERVLCVKNEVLVYKIPPRPSNRGYRADEWKLDAPDWTGRLRIVSLEKELFLKLEDKNSGELFAQCPVDAYPGIAVEPVMDSSRYFVIRIKDGSGRSAFIGIGFHDRSDSFDLNVAIQDHFKWLKQEAEEASNAKSLEAAPKLDLGFKEGQTIRLNLGTKKGDARPRNKPAAKSGGALGFLPPPPGGVRIPPPSGASSASSSSSSSSSPQPAASHMIAPPASSTFQTQQQGQSGVDLLLDLGSSAPPSEPLKPTAQNPPDLWGDFTGATGSQASSSNNSGGDWVQF